MMYGDAWQFHQMEMVLQALGQGRYAEEIARLQQRIDEKTIWHKDPAIEPDLPSRGVGDASCWFMDAYYERLRDEFPDTFQKIAREHPERIPKNLTPPQKE
jgi:hypothetical protein